MNYTSLNRYFAGLAIALCLPFTLMAQEDPAAETKKEVVRVSVSDGAIRGQVFTLLDNEKAPLVGKVSLTDADGKTISSLNTDDDGNFSFNDIEPGMYKAVGVAGDYVGDTEIEVIVGEEVAPEGEYTAIPLAVAPASSSAIFNTYSSLPAASFSALQHSSIGCSGGSCGGYRACSSCGGGSSRGVGFRSFGGCGGGCGGIAGGGLFGGGFGRLALIGGAVAIPIALAGGSSPDE